MSNLIAHLKEHHPDLQTKVMSSQKSFKDGISGIKKNVKVIKPV